MPSRTRALARWLFRLPRRFILRRREDRAAFLEACLRLARAYVLVRAAPFRWWSGRLGAVQTETPQVDEPAQRSAVESVRWALRKASNRLPWPSTCLMKALAGREMLHRRNIPCTLYLGVKADEQGERLIDEAHAWLRAGTTIVTGEEEYGRFVPVMWFGAENTSRIDVPG